MKLNTNNIIKISFNEKLSEKKYVKIFKNTKDKINEITDKFK